MQQNDDMGWFCVKGGIHHWPLRFAFLQFILLFLQFIQIFVVLEIGYGWMCFWSWN